MASRPLWRGLVPLAVIVSVEDKADSRAGSRLEVLGTARDHKGVGQGAVGAAGRQSAAQFGFPTVLP